MNEVVFDKQDQFDKISAGLILGESVVAVYDAVGAGTGFIGLTDKRVIVQDNSFVGKKIALTSIPYKMISSVSYVADKNIFLSASTINFSSGGKDYTTSFRGDAKAKHVHDIILWNVLAAQS